MRVKGSGPRRLLGLLALARKTGKGYPYVMSVEREVLFALAAVFFALSPSPTFAQGSPVGKTFALMPDDAAWGDVIAKTQPCSVPGESSCSKLNSLAAAAPLKSFSQGSAPTALVNQNNPEEVADAVIPALNRLPKGKSSGAISIEKVVSQPTLKNPPAIRGGNGTFTTLPAAVNRMSQSAQKTVRSLSPKDSPSSQP